MGRESLENIDSCLLRMPEWRQSAERSAGNWPIMAAFFGEVTTCALQDNCPNELPEGTRMTRTARLPTAKRMRKWVEGFASGWTCKTTLQVPKTDVAV